MARTPKKTYASVDEWRAEASRLFGDDPMHWKFVCPSCGHVASTQDWKDAGAKVENVGFSCVGRWLRKSCDIFPKGKGAGPCNYAGGGLLRLNPVEIAGGHNVFAFAERSAP